jgi:hypothetical protein
MTKILQFSEMSMMNGEKLTRKRITQALVNALEPLNYVHAFWEGGATAFDRIDAWSDVDLYLVVDDKKVAEAFVVVEKALKSLSPIKQKYEISHPPQSGIFQAFYRLKDASEYLIIDLAVLKVSSPDKFLEPNVHGKVVFYFNKTHVKPPLLDKEALVKKCRERFKRLRARFDMFNNFVQKEINRGNHLEAIDFYYKLILGSLVESLRIKHNAVHHDFKMRYIHYELPSEITETLKKLYFVTDEEDLQRKYHMASKWFYRVMLEIDRNGVERLVTL